MRISNLWNVARRGLPVFGISMLAACASSPKVEPRSAAATEIAVNVKSARAAYEGGNFSRAAKFYELALARARALDDSAEIGRNAYNAAACHLRAGNAKDAAALLVEADREFARSKMSPVPVLVLQSRAALELGRHSAAAHFASNAASHSKAPGELVEAMIVLADVSLKQGDLAGAKRAIDSVKSESKRGGAVAATIVAAEGRLFEAQAKFADAGVKYLSAADQWRDFGNAGEIAASLQSAGGAFAKAGEWAKSAELLYRAARSFFGQHDNLSALRCVESAMKSAEAAKDEALRDQIASLFAQIKKSVEPAGESN